MGPLGGMTESSILLRVPVDTEIESVLSRPCMLNTTTAF